MPRRNRVDPYGDIHATPERGIFTGNRGCLVDSDGAVVRHHQGNLWITCVTTYKDWRSPLAEPGRWTPLFFLDDAVALAAGHRPCGLCRRADYLSYRSAVETETGSPLSATDVNRLLAAERLRRGRGIDRAADRKTWTADVSELPVGTVIVDGNHPALVVEDRLLQFDFAGWKDPSTRPGSGLVDVLTPPTSVKALFNGYTPTIHPSASI